MVLAFLGVAALVTALAHLAPFPFALDALHANRVIWRMPHQDGPPTIYLTFDDGPNPEVTPGLLDVLSNEQVHATFFLIERHITPETEPILRRMADAGHALALHSHTRAKMLMAPETLAATLIAFARRLEAVTGRPGCRAFRPHAGARSTQLLEGLRRIDYQMIGWGFMLWDFDMFRPRSPRIVPRLVRHASPGDIVVVHDGHHVNPRADRRYAIDVARALIPALRQKGFQFGTICTGGLAPLQNLPSGLPRSQGLQPGLATQTMKNLQSGQAPTLPTLP
jgi:peptidoglycan/xylan/chitin deacetylase (PgdA/CDA1 family)